MQADRQVARLASLGTAGSCWLTKNLDGFAPWHNGRLMPLGNKAIGELALLYAYLEHWRNDALSMYLPLDDTLPLWRAIIIAHCEDAAYIDVVHRNPLHAAHLLFPYLMLRSTGYRYSHCEDILCNLARSGYLRAVEVTPYRFLEREHFLWKSGFLREEPRWRHIYKTTLVAKRCSPIHLDRDAAYAITHALFYLSDFGSRHIPLQLDELMRVKTDVECLLIHYWRSAYWDLMGELLINLNCLHGCDSPVYTSASRAFQRVWRKDGAIPANRSAEDELRSTQPGDRKLLRFRLCYHTTLVGVLYCATALNRFLGHEVVSTPAVAEGQRTGTTVA